MKTYTAEELNKIICPFCGVDQQLEYMYTNDDFHEVECCNCDQPFTYKLTEFYWESRDYEEDESRVCGNSKTNPPPADMEEYTIPEFKCEVEHWTIWKNWRVLSWLERLDFFILFLPVKIRKWYFELTMYSEWR